MKEKRGAAREEILYGINPVEEALNSGNVEIEKIFVAHDTATGRIGHLLRKGRERGIPISNIPAALLRRIVGTAKNQGIAALISEGHYWSRDEILATVKGDEIVLVVDSVEDPGNFGAIIRSSVAAGVTGIFIPIKGSVGMTKVVAKRSAGALVHARIAREKSLISLLEDLGKRGFHRIAVDQGGKEELFRVDVKFPLAVIIGSESRGIRKELIQQADSIVSIPMDEKVESLNVSVACGIVLYELMRRKICMPK